MHRTQIYFEEELFADIKQQADHLNMSISAYIRETLRKDLAVQQAANQMQTTDFSEFAGLWEDHDITQKALREKAWK